MDSLEKITNTKGKLSLKNFQYGDYSKLTIFRTGMICTFFLELSFMNILWNHWKKLINSNGELSLKNFKMATVQC